MRARPRVCVRACVRSVSGLACLPTIRAASRNDANMADAATGDAPPERTDFHELEDGEDLFPDPVPAQEVRMGGWGGGRRGAGGGQGVMLAADGGCNGARAAGSAETVKRRFS